MSLPTGKIVRRLRIKHNMLQKDLADKLNKAKSTISMWENGEREIDQESLVLIANLFNVSVDYLLGNSSDKILKDEAPLIDYADDFQFALYDKTKGISDRQKQDILNIIDILTKNEGGKK